MGQFGLLEFPNDAERRGTDVCTQYILQLSGGRNDQLLRLTEWSLAGRSLIQWCKIN